MGFGDSLRTAEDMEGWKGMVQRHLWCPDDLRGLGTEMRDEMMTINSKAKTICVFQVS